jgi:3-oxoacyl-[acyl-carrier protein] reductase
VIAGDPLGGGGGAGVGGLGEIDSPPDAGVRDGDEPAERAAVGVGDDPPEQPATATAVATSIAIPASLLGNRHHMIRCLLSQQPRSHGAGDPDAYPNQMQVAIVGGPRSLARSLAGHLAQRGAPTVTIGGEVDPDPPTDNVDGVDHLSCDLSSAPLIQDRLEAATTLLGEAPAVVRLGIAAAQTTATNLASLDLDTWVARTEAPLREALAFHQAAQRFLTDRGGRVVVVVPTMGLAGGGCFVPLATTAEADRTLVKAQARVSGRLGITLNTIAVTSALLAGADEDIDRGGLPALALDAPGLVQVAEVLLGLLEPAFAAVTGQTIAVDGGCWMAL